MESTFFFNFLSPIRTVLYPYCASAPCEYVQPEKSHNLKPDSVAAVQEQPHLVGQQAAALVSMLGAQSPLAQHVICSDLNRLGEPAVEQRVVQREGL